MGKHYRVIIMRDVAKLSFLYLRYIYIHLGLLQCYTNLSRLREIP